MKKKQKQKQQVRKTNDALELIERMESIRARNNINWMNVLRLAIIYSPHEEVAALFRSIGSCDNGINKLWKSLHETLRD